MNAATLLTTLASVIGAYLLYRGVKYTANASRQAASGDAQVAAQESALEAWKELLQPYRDDVKELRGALQLAEERRAAKERQDAQDRRDATVERAREKAVIQEQLTGMADSIDRLKVEVKHWKSLARVIARWATTLRDQVLSLGGTVPATPDELLLIQILDSDDDTALQPPDPR